MTVNGETVIRGEHRAQLPSRQDAAEYAAGVEESPARAERQLVDNSQIDFVRTARPDGPAGSPPCTALFRSQYSGIAISPAHQSMALEYVYADVNWKPLRSSGE